MAFARVSRVWVALGVVACFFVASALSADVVEFLVTPRQVAFRLPTKPTPKEVTFPQDVNQAEVMASKIWSSLGQGCAFTQMVRMTRRQMSARARLY